MKKIAMIIDKFDASIKEIEKSNGTQLIQLNQKIKRTQDCLNEFRQEVKLNDFTSSKSEIHFFKNQKPYIKGRLKFYVSLNNYLLIKPSGSKSKQRKFVNLQLSEIETEKCKCIDFLNYYQLEETTKDHTYFLRGVEPFELFIDNTTIFEDPEFCTLRDHLASEIIAKNLLIQFYTNELQTLKKRNSKPLIQEIQTFQKPKVRWTAPNISIVETMVSLKEKGALNNGNISMKELKDFAESIFNQKFGNFYKTYGEIKSRKANATKFLDSLKESLQNKINSDEDA